MGLRETRKKRRKVRGDPPEESGPPSENRGKAASIRCMERKKELLEHRD